MNKNQKILIISVIVVFLTLTIGGFFLFRMNNPVNPNQEQSLVKDEENQDQTIQMEEEHPKVENQILNNGGQYVKYNGYTYYREYTKDSMSNSVFSMVSGRHMYDRSEKGPKSKMVRIDDSSNKEELFDDTGDGKIFIFKDRMYLSGRYGPYSVDLNGENKKDHNYDFTDIDVENGMLYTSGSIINLNDDTQIEYNGEFMKYDAKNKVVYYQDIAIGEDDSAPDRDKKSTAKLYRMDYDGKNKNELSSVEIVASNMGYSNISCIQIKDDYIYFSYGSYEGTGNFFNGKLARVKSDGTDFEVILNQNSYGNPILLSERFIIENKNGEEYLTYLGGHPSDLIGNVNANDYSLSLKDRKITESVTSVMSRWKESYEMEIGKPFQDIGEKGMDDSAGISVWSVYTNEDGTKVELITENDLKNLGGTFYFKDDKYRYTDNVGYVGDYVYFNLQEGETQKDGREGLDYTRIKTQIYRKSLSTSKLELLHEY